MTTLTKAQLNRILSALDNQPRNPNTKNAALKAIGRHGERLGLSLDDILAAAGLLDGRMSAEAFRASLQEAEQPAEEPIEPEAEAPAEPESEAVIAEDEPADPLVEDTLAVPESEPEAEAPAELESEAAIAEVAPAEATNVGAPRQAPKLRNGTKQALMIAMLQRPEGATVEQIAEVTGWRNHTVRGAMAGALKKKLGLIITSEKTEGAARTYRIAD
jgi:hypothetical protein